MGQYSNAALYFIDALALKRHLLLLAGAQFGTVISYPLSGLLAEYGFADGWPSIFYVFGIVGAIWSVAFLYVVAEEPDTSSTIPEDERKYIINSLWGSAGVSVSTA